MQLTVRGFGDPYQLLPVHLHPMQPGAGNFMEKCTGRCCLARVQSQATIIARRASNRTGWKGSPQGKKPPLKGASIRD